MSRTLALGQNRRMKKSQSPRAISAEEAPLRQKASNYPEPYFSRMLKRQKRPLGDLFGLKNFGVNLTRLVPGGESALMHSHSRQDEMISSCRAIRRWSRSLERRGSRQACVPASRLRAKPITSSTGLAGAW